MELHFWFEYFWSHVFEDEQQQQQEDWSSAQVIAWCEGKRNQTVFIRKKGEKKESQSCSLSLSLRVVMDDGEPRYIKTKKYSRNGI